MGRKFVDNGWYTVKEAAAVLPVTEATIAKYCRNGEFRPKARKRGSTKIWYILGKAIKNMREEFE